MSPLPGSLLRERLGYALSTGGGSATLWWLFKKVGRVQAYHLLASTSEREASSGNTRTSRFALRSVSSSTELKSLEADQRVQLEEHSGRGLDRLMSEKAIVYFLTDKTRVVCQLSISTGGLIRVDSPSGITFDIGAKSAFLSYLFTHEGYRRIGAAQQLIGLARKDLGRYGVERIVAHVSVTNVPSLNTFTQSGWRRIGTVWTTRGGRLLSVTGLSVPGVRVYSSPLEFSHDG
jgi:GNAT superfamily N-acetyltransferase